MTLMIGSSKITPSIFPKNNIKNQDKTITENGVYTADEGYTGLGEVTVDVLSANNEDKVILENGVYEADYEKGYTGLGEVTVAINAIGATEVATNRTGAAINAGDKVWVNQEYYEAGEGKDITGYQMNSSILTGDLHYTLTGTTAQNIDNLNTYDLPDSYSIGWYGLYSDGTAIGLVGNSNYKTLVFFKQGISISRSNARPILALNNKKYYWSADDSKIHELDDNLNEIGVSVSTFSGYNSTSEVYAGAYINGYLYNRTGYYDGKLYKITDLMNGEIESTTNLSLSWNSPMYYAYTNIRGITNDSKYLVCGNNGYLIDINNPTNVISDSRFSGIYWYTGSDCGTYYKQQPSSSSTLIQSVIYNSSEFKIISYDQSQLSNAGLSSVYSIYNDEVNCMVVGSRTGGSGYYQGRVAWFSRILGNQLINYSNFNSSDITGTAAEDIAVGAKGNVYLGDKGNLQSKAATSNGTIRPDSDYYGLKSITVNVVGDGVEVEGKNYTGAVINEGDKVWINPYYYEAGTTYTTITNGYSGADGYGAIVLPDGNSVAYTKSGSVEAILYDFVTNNNLGSLSYKPNSLGDSNTGSFGSGSACCFRYIDGTVYTKNSSGMQRIDSGLSWGKSNYSPIYGSSEYIFNFNDCTINYIDKNNGDIIKTYSLPIITDIEYWKFVRNQNVSPVFLDKNHILFPWYNYSVKRTYILSLNDENNSADIIKYYNVDACYPSFSRPVMLGITSDKKYLINIGLTYNTPTISNINVYDISDIDNNLSLVSNKFPELIELALGKGSQADYYNNYIAAIQNQVTLDPKNNLLWSPRFLSISSTQLPYILKYNPNDESFTVINMDYISLSQEVNATSFIGCSGDLDAIWFNRGSGNKPIKLNINISSGNSLINYNISNINSQTGTASEIISAGSTGTVKVGAVINEAKNVIATNLTSSNINIGDKVWLNISTNELVDFINATQDTYTAIADESIEINATGQVHYQD